MEYNRRLWSPGIGWQTLLGAGAATAIGGIVPILSGAAWPGVVAFSCIGLVIGAMGGWLSALDGDPDADHR